MQIEADTILHQTAWLRLRETRYRDRAEALRKWVYVERCQERRAVYVIAHTGESGSLVLIRQYRVPLRKEVIEFPAGLIDEGEDFRSAAARELAEETGYRPLSMEDGPLVCTNPGLSNELSYVVRCRVPEHPQGSQALEGSERIQVLLLPPSAGMAILDQWEAEGLVVDAKLYGYLLHYLS